MPKIKNYDIYNSEMEKGMKDKLFFVKFLNPDLSYTFIDFGCANGKLLEQLSKIRENTEDLYIGYDKSPDMISFAKSQWNGIGHILFTTNWEDCLGLKNPILILSSVIHEVYSYGKKKDIAEFWNFVLNTGFDYVVVRDMCPTADIDRQTPAEVLRFFNNNISEERKRQIKEFEERWGSLKKTGLLSISF